jgi:multiple sugar transport system ATP-binding protein
MTMGDRIVVMRHGVIQQIGTPESVYDHPANTFVASFVGSPGMNLLAGEIGVDGGRTTFRAGKISVELPAGIASAWMSRANGNRAATLGVRSEAIQLAGERSQNASEAAIVFLEPAGADLFVKLEIDGNGCIARTPRRSDLAENQRVWVNFDPDEIHVFDDAGVNVALQSDLGSRKEDRGCRP